MTFNRFNRRLHLYLAMALLPWFLMYGLSAMVMSHRGYLSRLIGEGVEWTPRFEKAYDGGLAMDADVAARRDFGRRVADDHDPGCNYRVSRITDGRIVVTCATFFAATRYSYDVRERWLTAEHTRFDVDRILTRMHNQSGFQHDRFLPDLWAVFVDLVSLGFLIWAASGLYMWWKLPGQRGWGVVALFAGLACFVAFLLGL